MKLSLTIRLPTSSDYSLELDLARAVVPEQSQVKILSSRVLMLHPLLDYCITVPSCYWLFVLPLSFLLPTLV